MANQQKQKPKATVATPSSTYLRMQPRWRMIESLLGGTETMRDAGTEFLPQYENESNKNYQVRLARATLLNSTEQTLNTLAGKPFREQVVLEDDVPEKLIEMAEDIDLLGNNLHSFCRAWFREGWAKGLSHVLIENPTAEELPEGQVRTRADDLKENRRPYWIHINPECAIAAYSQVIMGKEQLTHLRLSETTIEQDGWEEVEVTRIRVLEPGAWWVYEQVKKDEWAVVDSGLTSLDYIPLVTFYSSKRTGLMECKPPLTDLAFLNVAHWQSSSDQRNVLTVSRFPILAASGVPADATIKVGPNNFLTTEDVQGKWYYVEHTGAAIASGHVDLQSLETQMASYGAEYMRKRPGDETATGRALDAAEASSYLAATVRDFQDCVEQAMSFTASMVKLELDEGGSVRINTDVDLTEADSAELDALLKLRAARDISRKTILSEMQTRGILADDFDEEGDFQLLQEEGSRTLPDMFGGGQGTALQHKPPVADPAQEDPTPAPGEPISGVE